MNITAKVYVGYINRWNRLREMFPETNIPDSVLHYFIVYFSDEQIEEAIHENKEMAEFFRI